MAGARRREARNQRVLEIMMELSRPATISQLAKLSGISRGVLEDATAQLAEAGLVHAGEFMRDGRAWATVDVPFTAASPSPKEKKTVAPELTKLGPTQRGIILAAQAYESPFTAGELAVEAGRDASTVSELIRKYPELFEKTRDRRNKSAVWKLRTRAVPEPAAFVPPAVPEMDVVAKIRALVGGADESARIAELEAENADLKVRLAKARAALTAALGE
jgi:hypothetical protein